MVMIGFCAQRRGTYKIKRQIHRRRNFRLRVVESCALL